MPTDAGPVLFVAAGAIELQPFVNRWDHVKKVSLAVHWARRGRWKGQDVAAIANGPGAERAFSAAILAGNISAVWSVGVCGALDENLDIADVVIGTEIWDGTSIWTASVPAGPAKLYGRVASIDHVAATAEEKSNLRASGASIVEMEAAGVARVAEDSGIPFYCVKAVSDLSDESFVNDFNAAITDDGHFSAFRLIAGAFKDPAARFSELLRLQRRTAAATKTLGEFLANCTFQRAD